jgi:hypothetical protein
MKSTIEDLVAGWSDEYKKLAAPAIKEIQRLLAAGDAPDSAVRKAFYKFGIDEKLAGTLLDSATKAAARGLGIPGASANQSARDKLERLPWTPDNMPLSQRLHGASATMRQRIVSEIDGALAQGGNWKAIAKNLYDGYGFPTTINSAALPTYLDELLKASRTMDNGAELRAALRKANRQIKLLGQDGAPNQALKAAYRQIVRAVESGSDKRIDNAVRVGVEEKSRYHAERIARTEIARAWSEGFWAEHGPEELTVAVAWKLSSRHPIYDICDFHAHANLYGLGPGVYPKDRAPRLPAHPHCTCHLSPVFDGEVGQPDVDPQHVLRRGADFLRGLDDYERQRLLTIEGEKAWRAGDSWQNQLRNWQGHGDNRPRLTKEDFTLPAPNGLKQKIDALRNGNSAFGDVDDLIKLGTLIDEEIAASQALQQALQTETSAQQAVDKTRRGYLDANAAYSAKTIEYGAVLDSYTLYDNARKAHAEALKAKAAAHADALKEALSQIRELGPSTPQPWTKGSKKDAVALFNEMAPYMPRTWLEESARTPMLAKTVKRGFYLHSGKYGIAEYALSGTRSVAAHEFGHRVERVVPGVLAIESAYYARRTANEQLQWLGPGYRKTEHARKDKFTNAYIGKDYHGTAYEILSMGLEGTVYGGNGLGINTVDPETRRLILGIMGAR